MRAILMLLATTGCSQIFGIETPQRLDGAVDIDAAHDAPTDISGRITVTFQNGAAGYSSARDTWIDAGQPNIPRDGDTPLRVRDADRWGLLAFEQLFGNAPAQIPPGVTIENAHLDLVLANNNCQASIAEIAASWPDTVTYNTFGPTPGVQMTEDYSAPFAVLPTAMIGRISVDVTASVKAWQTAPATNIGWLLIGTGGVQDCAVRASDENQMQLRPLLSVTYAP